MSNLPIQIQELLRLVSPTNLIINGNFDFWQRGTTGTSVATTASQYLSCDRWFMSRNTGDWTASQDTDVPDQTSADWDDSSAPVKYSVSITKVGVLSATSGYSGYGQIIEAQNVVPAFGKDVTLSFWVKTKNTGTYTIFLSDYTAASGRYDKHVTYTVNQADTWEKKEITFRLDALDPSQRAFLGSERGLMVIFRLFTGTDFVGSPRDWTETPANPYIFGDADSPVVADTDYIKIAQVQLTKGNYPTAFRRAGNNIQEELAMCQRYYRVLSGAGSEYPVPLLGRGNSSSAVRGTVLNGATEMRTTSAKLTIGADMRKYDATDIFNVTGTYTLATNGRFTIAGLSNIDINALYYFYNGSCILEDEL